MIGTFLWLLYESRVCIFQSSAAASPVGPLGTSGFPLISLDARPSSHRHFQSSRNVCVPVGLGLDACAVERGTWWEAVLRLWVLPARGCGNVGVCGIRMTRVAGTRQKMGQRGEVRSGNLRAPGGPRRLRARPLILAQVLLSGS